jgi:protoporphyrinogen oxidase
VASDGIVHVDVLVIGAGLAGLAARAAIGSKLDTLTVEASDRIGGLARVYQQSDFVFDSVPHVLQFRSPKLISAVARGLPHGLRWFPKSSLIYQEGSIVRYPYQFNAFDLPEERRNDCVSGLDDTASTAPPGSFARWLVQQFGSGFYECFFKPYNTKLYGEPLCALEAAPLKWTIPANNHDAITLGAQQPWPEPPPIVAYPRGPLGVEELVRSLERSASSPIRLNSSVVSIDPIAKIAKTSDGLTVRWRTVIATLPLPTLTAAMVTGGAPIAAKVELRARDIQIIEIGATESGPGLPAIWTYVPDQAIPFYRLTRLERLSPELAPAGGTAILLEVAGEPLTKDRALFEILKGHVSEVARLRRAFAQVDVFTAGRYGAWLYADIEMTLKSGLGAAAAVFGRLRVHSEHKGDRWGIFS